jgi:hypothetical protein
MKYEKAQKDVELEEEKVMREGWVHDGERDSK